MARSTTSHSALALLLLALAAVTFAQDSGSGSFTGDGSVADDSSGSGLVVETPTGEPDTGLVTEDSSGSMGGGDGGKEPTTTPPPPPTTYSKTITTSMSLTGKAPSKAELAAAMVSSLTSGDATATVEVKLVQSSTVPVPDSNGVFCGTSAVNGILTLSENGMGVAMTLYNTTNDEWESGNTIGAACAAVSGRRRLQTQQVDHAVTANDDVSQYVQGATFETSLLTAITAEVNQPPSTFDATDFSAVASALPTSITINKDAIVYDNAIEYVVTYATSGSAPADTVFEGALETSLTSALTAEGLDSSAVQQAVAAAGQNVQVANTPSTGGGSADISAASSVTVVASLVAGLVALLL